MKTEQNESQSRLKAYHIFYLSCLLCSVFILNSNYVNEKRSALKEQKEQNSFFNGILDKRILQENIGGEEDIPGTEEKKIRMRFAQEAQIN